MDHLTIRSRSDEIAIDLARRLKARAPELTCRVCGHRDFGLVEEPKAQFRTYLRRYQGVDGPYHEKSISQKLLTLICTHCGHIEQFAEAVLEGAKPEEYGAEVGGE